MTHPLVSFAAFQLFWLACVGGAARGLPWLGPVAVAGYVALHLRATPAGRARAGQAWLLGLAGILGYVADSGLVLSGVLTFPPQAVLGWPSTVWMVALWVLQAATFGGTMSWLDGRFGLATIVGAVAGPMGYLAGERMGAAFLGPTHLMATAVVALEWAAAMPALLWLERRARAGAAMGEPAKDARLAR